MRIAPPRRHAPARASLVALITALAVIAPSLLVLGAAPPSAAAAPQPAAVPADTVTPTVTVTPSTGLEPGDIVTVSGTGFGPVPPATTASRPPLAGQFGGVYVVFGSFASTWKPSEGAPSAARVGAPGQTRWVVNPENVATIGGAARGGVAINSDGSFEVQLTVTDEFTGMLADGTLGVYTYAGGGVVYAPFETATPLVVAVPEPEPTPEPTPDPEVTLPAPPGPTTAGSLRWGVKQSFDDYVTGPIAQGRITVSGADVQGSAFVFPQSTAAVNPAAPGAVSFGGAVRYVGHDGLLDVTIANPTVRIVSASRGELVATVNGTRVALATLALDRGTRSELPDGAVRWAGVPATLTAAGAPVFSYQGSAFYAAGTALDPVTLTIGAPTGASGGSRVVDAFVERRIPSTPPATTGATVVGLDAAALQPGQSVTLSASGFGAGETGIAVVAYSEPTVLSETVVADRDGVATWTGTLPAGLVGVHTLTLQGSVDRGIVVTIRELAATVSIAGACPLQDAELTWGFSESFRAYISGSIANGEWRMLDGATYETPAFRFSGAGALEPATGEGEIVFTGAVQFVGHGGILDTTLANPRLVMLDDRSAQLVVDVTGTTQAGDAVAAEGVVFADIDLSAATRTAEQGELVIAEAPATLTVTGAEAFGTYPPGETLDPITIMASLADDCGAAAVADTGAAAPLASETGVPGWVWVLLVALLAIVAALAAAVVVLRRRAVTAA